EPVADAARSILDGHVVLTRELASAGHFPAIDVLESKSRVRDQIVIPPQRDAANMLQRLMSARREKEDLIAVGAYQAGTHPLVDTAIRLHEPISDFLRQTPEEHQPFTQTRTQLMELAAAAAQQ